jgi:uroporphyrinogen-III synthase
MRRVLVLRPQPGASATVGRAREHGLDPLAVPLFEVEPVAWSAPDPAGFDGLLLTSANAVRHGGEQLERLRGLSVYAVGETTAVAARAAGFGVGAVGDAGVDRLLASVAPDLKLLHLCGADRRQPQQPPQEITPVVVYRSTPIESPDLSSASGSIALIHSPRAGRRFAELVRDKGSIAVVAISDTAADAAGSGWQSTHVADEPSDEALLALAARLCNNPDPK